MKTLAIIGSGDLGQQIAHYAISDNHYKKVVFFDDFTKEKQIGKHKVLGKIKDIKKAFKNRKFDELIIAIGYHHLDFKEKCYNEFKNKIPFGKMIHSSSWIDPSAKIDAGVVIYPNCTIDAKVHIKANTLLNISCSIAHDTLIGKHCFLSPRVAMAGFIKIENKCILGINSTIIDNISIIESTQIGAGTVVVKNITNKGLYVGIPAKKIK